MLAPEDEATSTMNLNDTLSVSEEVVARDVGGEMVLLDLASGQYFGLDKVGGRTWELLSQRSYTIAELCDVVEAEFDAPRERIEEDLRALASQLAEQKLIVAQSA